MTATTIVHANLDCEAAWSGIVLPQTVARRISLYGTLAAALAPDGPCEVWVPAPVDVARLAAIAPVVCVGTPPHADVRWADPSARAANDRRLAHAVAASEGFALSGARTIASVDELVLPGPWVAKVPWTSAGRDRCQGAGPPTTEQRTRLGRLLQRSGALVVEPWCERLFDVGVCATVADDGTVTAQPPHGLVSDLRGGFGGIDLAMPPLAPPERALLDRAVHAAGRAIAARGHRGPFAIDAFAYRDAAGARRFHPLCEINARYTFGWVARALAARHGVTRLGFANDPPAGAITLIAPAGDGVTAWCA